MRVPHRSYRVVADEKTDVFFINIAKFYYFFTDLELKKMMNHVIRIDHSDITEKVKDLFATHKASSEAILDGMGVNFLDEKLGLNKRSFGDESPRRSSKEKSPFDRPVKKKKVQILDVNRSSKQVKEAGTYIKDFEVHHKDLLRMLEEQR
mmetsp:Transcript_18988/g.29127  ORF Transcript_18988/g.29127 Transcript_18988/m.29127 type:complete len:150 (+) Transcript_18988:554-1003(+)